MNTRTMMTRPTEFQTREADGKLYIEGYFAVFGSIYEMWDGGRETIAPTAFDGALDDDIRALTNHDTTLVLGRTTAYTLTLRVDEHGLWGSILVNQQDQDAMNLYHRVQRGDVSQCSFGFDILEEKHEERNGVVTWTILRVKLFEVSVCTFPAYTETSVEARKDEAATIKRRKLEVWRSDAEKRLKGEV